MVGAGAAWRSRVVAWHWGTALLLLLALGFALLRLGWLGADPSLYLVEDVFTDEGWYAQNARNHALFGRWVMDEHNPALVLCPLHTLLLRASYASFGVSFWSTRLTGAVASALTVGLVAWGLRSRPRAAALAAALVATQPLLFSLSRVAYCESLQLFFVTATWALLSGERRGSWNWFLAGSASALAVLSKASALYAPLLAASAPFLLRGWRPRRRTLGEVGLVVAGGLVATLPFAVFEWPLLDVLRVELAREGGSTLSLLPRGPALLAVLGLWQGGVHPGFWAGILGSVALAGAVASRQLVTRPAEKQEHGAPRVAGAWIALSLLALAWHHTIALQERYWANLLVPLACLVALGVEPRVPALAPRAAVRWSAALALAFGPALALRTAVFLALPGPPQGGTAPRLPGEISAAVALVLLGLLAIAFHRLRLPERLARVGPLWPSLAWAAVIGGAVASSGVVARPTYTVRDAAHALAARSATEVLTGSVADTLALETPFFAFERRDLATWRMGSGWINEDWRKLGATLWIGYRADEEPPDARSVLEAVYPVWPDRAGRERILLRVYRLPH